MFINLRIILVSIVLLLVLAVATTDSASASIQDPQRYHRGGDGLPLRSAR